jgi:hypothetical protein
LVLPEPELQSNGASAQKLIWTTVVAILPHQTCIHK